MLLYCCSCEVQSCMMHASVVHYVMCTTMQKVQLWEVVCVPWACTYVYLLSFRLLNLRVPALDSEGAGSWRLVDYVTTKQPDKWRERVGKQLWVCCGSWYSVDWTKDCLHTTAYTLLFIYTCWVLWLLHVYRADRCRVLFRGLMIYFILVYRLWLF